MILVIYNQQYTQLVYYSGNREREGEGEGRRGGREREGGGREREGGGEGGRTDFIGFSFIQISSFPF